MSKFAGNRIKINLTAKEEIPKNSAIPPQTPIIDLSVCDFLNFCFICIPLQQCLLVKKGSA